MNNIELIDDYLTNKLSEQDKKSFEQQLTSDPALKANVELQKEIIRGLKAARAAELKAMLNQVPVNTFPINLTPLRIAAGLIGAAVVASGLYFYFEGNQSISTSQLSSSLVDSIRQTEQNELETIKESITDEVGIEEQPVKTDNPPKTSTPTPSVSPNQPENKPAIDVLDPTDELSAADRNPVTASESKPAISVSKIDINIINTERKFKSHYQFSNGKLVLYGNFDKGLYEIIEVNGQQSRSLFLNYRTSYYLLDESQKEITPLKEITDPVLIQKLKSFQSK